MIARTQHTDGSLCHALKTCVSCGKTNAIGASRGGLPCTACPILEALDDATAQPGPNRERLSRKDKALVVKSFAQLKPQLELFTLILYDALFARHPHFKIMFKGDQGEQSRKLAAMLTTMVKGLDRMETVKPAVWALGQRHVRYGVRPIDYKIFWNALLIALETFLQDEFTSDVRNAWMAFYRCMTSIMLGLTDRHVSTRPGTHRVA